MTRSRLFTLEHAANTDDWYTPPWIFEGMGVTFDLDVAAPPGGCPWIPARAHYSIGDDGLSQPWEGFIWCNPPYSSPTQWCYRWADHRNGIIVLRADLSTRGPFTAFAAASSIYVADRRIQFVNGHGERHGAVNFSSVLLGVGERADAALVRLSHRGIFRQLREVL